MLSIKKSLYDELCKAMGKDPEFENLKAEVLSILHKKQKSEKKEVAKALLEMESNYTYLSKSVDGSIIQKSGYPVGTIREWKGQKYIKIAPNKWKPKYDSESKGAKNALTRLINQVENCKDVDSLMKIVMENKQRFTDANGNHLPIVDKLRAAADKKNDSLSSPEAERHYSVKENRVVNNKQELLDTIEKYKNSETKGGKLLYEGAKQILKNKFGIGEEELERHIKELAEQNEAEPKQKEESGKGEDKYFESEYEYYKNNLSKDSDLETIKIDLEKEKRNAEKKNDTRRLTSIKAKEKVIEEIEAEKKEEPKAVESKPSLKMSYKTLMSLPDSKEKFLVLENKLMKLQHHGEDFFEAKKEWRRLFDIYRGESKTDEEPKATEKTEESGKDIKDMSDDELNSAISEREKLIKDLEKKNEELYYKNSSFSGDNAQGKDYKQWLENASKMKKWQAEAADFSIERGKRKAAKIKSESKKKVNGYGEATDREITSGTYERAEKRRQKDVDNFLGVKKSTDIQTTVKNALAGLGI